MRRASFVAPVVPSLGIAGYAVVGYALLPLGARLHPDMRAAFEAHRTALYAHVFASAVALALGPFQFAARLRTKHLAWHRRSGRLRRRVRGSVSGHRVAVLGAEPAGRGIRLQPDARRWRRTASSRRARRSIGQARDAKR
jgi:Predicted membrane protein (DUF2306)